MSRLRRALISPNHVVLMLIVAWVGSAVFLLDLWGVMEPDYRRDFLLVLVAYWVTVGIEFVGNNNRN
jgi:hypothetical protein